MTNEEIARRIKQARLERGFTQKDLAKFLNKTPSNISDIERCRVQVSAVELHIIAQALNKPIEFFYGEELGDDIENTLVLLRKQSPEAIEQSLKTVGIFLRMQNLQQAVQVGDRDLTPEETEKFIVDFMTFLLQFDQLTKQVDQARTGFNQMLEEQGIDLPALMSSSK